MIQSVSGREKIGRASTWMGIALVVNSLFLSLCTFVYAMWEHPLEFHTYLDGKSNVASDKLAVVFLIAGAALCLLSLFTNPKRKPAGLGLAIAALLFGFHFLAYFVPPKPSPLELDKLAEHNRFVQYMLSEEPSELDTVEKRLIEENSKILPAKPEGLELDKLAEHNRFVKYMLGEPSELDTVEK